MKTIFAEPEPQQVDALYLVSGDGTVVRANECILVRLTEEAANSLTDDHVDNERFLMASTNASACYVDQLWWSHKERS